MLVKECKDYKTTISRIEESDDPTGRLYYRVSYKSGKELGFYGNKLPTEARDFMRHSEKVGGVMLVDDEGTRIYRNYRCY